MSPVVCSTAVIWIVSITLFSEFHKDRGLLESRSFVKGEVTEFALAEPIGIFFRPSAVT